MYGDIPVGSLLSHLGRIPDVRSRQGRKLPLGSVLAMLILGALNGETSLRGMWMWGRNHWRLIKYPLGFVGIARPPVYSAVWTILSAVDPGLVQSAYQEWVASWAGKEPQTLSVDGKTLRGSRRTRSSEPALQVVTVVGQDLQVVLGEREVKDGDAVEAALELLRATSLEGKLVTADAGLLCRSFVKTVLDGGGDYLGVVKDNQPELKRALDEWVEEDRFPPEAGAPAG